jgi:hypothetical protein
MKFYLKTKASKLALYINARTMVRVSAKRKGRFITRFRRSMKHASTVKEAVTCIRMTSDAIWKDQQFRTRHTWEICKERVEQLWEHGDLGPLAHLRNDTVVMKKTLAIYFDAVAREKTDASFEAMMKQFLDLFLQQCNSVISAQVEI